MPTNDNDTPLDFAQPARLSRKAQAACRQIMVALRVSQRAAIEAALLRTAGELTPAPFTDPRDAAGWGDPQP